MFEYRRKCSIFNSLELFKSDFDGLDQSVENNRDHIGEFGSVVKFEGFLSTSKSSSSSSESNVASSIPA